MKTLLKLLLVAVLTLFGTGMYLQSISDEKGDFFVGIGVLLLAFGLLPLFVYHRYKDKDLSEYSFKNRDGSKKDNPS